MLASGSKRRVKLEREREKVLNACTRRCVRPHFKGRRISNFLRPEPGQSRSAFASERPEKGTPYARLKYCLWTKVSFRIWSPNLRTFCVYCRRKQRRTIMEPVHQLTPKQFMAFSSSFGTFLHLHLPRKLWEAWVALKLCGA